MVFDLLNVGCSIVYKNQSQRDVLLHNVGTFTCEKMCFILAFVKNKLL